MIIGLVTYLSGRRHLPPDKVRTRSARIKLNGDERRCVLAILWLLVPYTLYSASSFQAYGIMYVWADTAVNRVVLGWEVPVTWIGILDGVLTIMGVMLADRIWICQASRGREPTDFTKIAIGYLGVGLAFFIAAACATLAVVPLLLWAAFFVVLDFSYGWAEPPIQSLVSRDSPPSVSATMMATLKASVMLSYFLLGWLGRFYEPLGAPLYWALTGALSIGGFVMMIVFRKPVLRLLEPQHGPAAGPTAAPARV
jgi:POT family proton-dependent oligopeptide transporter